MVNDCIDWDVQEHGNSNTDQTCHETNDNRLRVKYTRDILLRCTDASQHTNLLRPLQYGNICDDTNHDRAYHERDCHERHQHIRNRIDNRTDGRHHRSYHICVRDFLLLFAVCFHHIVIFFDHVDDLFLRLKIDRIDADDLRIILISDTKCDKVVIIGRILSRFQIGQRHAV